MRRAACPQIQAPAGYMPGLARDFRFVALTSFTFGSPLGRRDDALEREVNDLVILASQTRDARRLRDDQCVTGQTGGQGGAPEAHLQRFALYGH